jgi:hypothetical protein
MLTNSLQRTFFHYTVFDKESNVARDFETAPFWSFLGGEDELRDALLDVQLSPFRIPKQR